MMTNQNQPPKNDYHDYEKEKLALQLKDLTPQEYDAVVRELAKRMGL